MTVRDRPGDVTGGSVGSPILLIVLLLTSTLGVMGGAIVVPVLEVIRGDLGVSGTASGLIVTSHGLAIALVSPLMGKLISRWGVRVPMICGLVVYGLAGGAGLVVTSFPMLIASRLLFGVGAAAVFSGTTVSLLSFYQGSVRDRVMGWRSTAMSLGGLVWPLLGGALGGISWHATFGIYLIGVPIAVAVLLVLPNTAGDSTGGGGGVLTLLRQRRRLLAWYGMMISVAIMMYALAVFLPQRLAEIGIEAPLLVSLYSVVAGAAATSLIGLVYARLRARLSYAVLLRSAALAWVIAFGIFATVSHPVVLLAAPLLLGCANGVVMPAVTVLIDETAGPRWRARAASLTGTAVFTGQFVSPLLLGPLIEATSTTTGFLAAACFAAVLLTVLLAARITDPVPEPDADADPATAGRAGS